MPLVDTKITSEDIKQITRKHDLYRRTWRALQQAEDVAEAHDTAYEHLDLLQKHLHLDEQIEFETMDGPLDDTTQQVDIIVHLADYREPVPLLYFDWNIETNEALGGDLHLY